MSWTSYSAASAAPRRRHLHLAATLAFAACLGLPGFSQSNEIMDSFLAEERAELGKAAYFVLMAADMIPQDATIETALTELGRRGWKIKIREADSPIKLGEFSLLLMQALEIRGGVMYSVFKGPRYAARELDYRGFITGKSHPGRTLSGEEALRMLSRVLLWKEERT